MHASVEQQRGSCSPKPVNGSVTSPLKNSPDSRQNSSSNIFSHTKGKKRERGDQSSEAIKQEQSVRVDDGDCIQLRSESMLNWEIAKFSEKGGLVDSDGVLRLVRLMQPDKSEKKINLKTWSRLANVIAATDKLDCLNLFVKLRGLPVLDEWLQEIRKGKISELGNLKDSDRPVEDFLLVLLRALDKLPVNINALQMCNIGKSVNHLRSHKNYEIQKKARSLVDTWKKRVEAEMNINDAKSGLSQAVPCRGRSRHGGSHGGNRHSSGSSDTAIRSSVTDHSSLKSASVKLVQAESNCKSASAYRGGAVSTLSPTSTVVDHKDGQSRITVNVGSSEPRTMIREEKSSSSSQCDANSQCFGDHAKLMVPCGKDTRNSTARSRGLNKSTGSGSKHQKSANGSTSGIRRETMSNRSSLMARISVVESVSQNAIDASTQDGNDHKLIVEIPNRGQDLAQSITGGSVEDSSCRNSRASSPALSEKHYQSDACLRKHDSSQSNVVDDSSTAVHQRTTDARRLLNVPNVQRSPSRNEMKSGKAHYFSFSSMNALIESCAKFSEANASMSAGDDVGMNLLASVAAREISKSASVSPPASPHRNSPAAENSSSNYSVNPEQLHGDNVIQPQGQPTIVADAHNCIDVRGVSKVNDGDTSKQSGISNEDIHQNVECCLKKNGILDENVGTASPSVSPACTTRSVGNVSAGTFNGKGVIVEAENPNQLAVASQGCGSSVEAENKVKVASLNSNFENKACIDTLLYLPSNSDEKSNVCQGLQGYITLEQKTLTVVPQSESMSTSENPAMASSRSGQHLASVNTNEVKYEKTNGGDLCDHAGRAGIRKLDQESDPSSMPEEREESVVRCGDLGRDTMGKDSESKEASVRQSDCSDTHVSSYAVDLPETELHSTAEGSKSSTVEEERKEDSTSASGTAALLPASGGSDADAKLGFDLNECFDVDEGKYAEPVSLATSPCTATARSVSSLPIPVSSASGSLPASVIVAADAMGPFAPPDDLLRNKKELGWKGSAATGAFRPTEPRKVMEVPLGPNQGPLPDAPGCKPARPPLDIDLNVADESFGQESNFESNHICELMTTASLHSSGGLDLDLNIVDEAPDVGRQSASSTQTVGVSTWSVKPSPSNIFSNGEASGRGDFDLNNGPMTEDMPVDFVEQISYSQHVHSMIPLQPPFGPRINSSDARSCFSWYPQGTGFSVSVSPSALPDREVFSIIGIGGGPQRVMGGPTSTLSFNLDAYRGSVLSSSAAMPFHPASLQYPVLPFETSFPLPTSNLTGESSGYIDPACSGLISTIPSQLVGNATAVSFQYPHSYIVSRPIPEVSNNGVIESNQKWGKQVLDLSSGPGGLNMERRNDSLPTVSRQISTISSQNLVEEQARMYSMDGGLLKRKEPEGGWNMGNLNFKQSSWR